MAFFYQGYTAGQIIPYHYHNSIFVENYFLNFISGCVITKINHVCAFCRLKNVTHTCFSINKCMSVQMNHEICITLLINIVFFFSFFHKRGIWWLPKIPTMHPQVPIAQLDQCLRYRRTPVINRHNRQIT